MFTDGEGTTQQAVYLTLVCVYARAVFTLLHAVALKTDKKDYKNKDEVRVVGATS